MEIKRLIRQKLYDYDRYKQKRLLQHTKGSQTILPGMHPRARQKRNTYSRGHMYRTYRANGISKLLGMAFIALGCLLLLTRCFRINSQEVFSQKGQVIEVGAMNEPMLVEQKVPAENSLLIQEEDLVVKDQYESPFIVVSDEGGRDYYKDLAAFEISEKDYNNLVNLSVKSKREIASSFAIWLVESTREESSKMIERIIQGKESNHELLYYKLYEEVAVIYRQFIYDIKYFPINEKKNYSYDNTWGQGSTFFLGDGVRIFDDKNTPGRIEVYSMSDGVIEYIGWDDRGGYCIGVRMPNGAVIHYAHLHEVVSSLKTGGDIKAGKKLGTIGNTGTMLEGAKGEAAVQLYIGITATTYDGQSLSINPYPILVNVESNKVKLY